MDPGVEHGINTRNPVSLPRLLSFLPSPSLVLPFPTRPISIIDEFDLEKLELIHTSSWVRYPLSPSHFYALIWYILGLFCNLGYLVNVWSDFYFLYYVMVGCQGVVKLVSQGNLLSLCYIMFSFMCNKWKTLSLGFNANCFQFLEQIWFNCSFGRMTGNAFDPLPLPSGVLVPMCWCGDPCKVAKSDEEDTYRQRYWMCDPSYHPSCNTQILGVTNFK
jgi:hypothetical protein